MREPRRARRGGRAASSDSEAGAQRLQKLLASLGLASRREAEQWIRAGRLTVNGRAAVLGTRAREGDELRLDGRLIRRRAPAVVGVLLCHRSPGEPLAGFAERLPQRSGRRFISVSPMPLADGGLELLTADGALAARLQRAVGALEMEVSVRVRGEIDEAQQRSLLAAGPSDGARVSELEPLGGEGANRWYRLTTVGLSGAQLRTLLERTGVTPIRALRTRLGSLSLPRTLLRGRWRSLEAGELNALIGSPGSGP